MLPRAAYVVFSSVLLLTRAMRLYPQPDSTRSAPITEGILTHEGVIDRPIAGSATRRWTISVRSGEFVDITLLPKHGDVTARVVSPSGALSLPFDAPASSWRLQRVQWIANETGPWIVELTPSALQSDI